MKNIFSIIGEIIDIKNNNNSIILFIKLESNSIIPITLPESISNIFNNYREYNTPISVIGKIEYNHNQVVLIAKKISYISDKI